MSFQHYGKDQIGKWVENNVEQAKHLHGLAMGNKDFDSATEPSMSAICIRYKNTSLTNEELTKLHRNVAARIEKEGKFWFATTELKGKTWFRINPVNINTTIETMEALFDMLKEYCKEAYEMVQKK
jgi:glutamate/tyrosine decarboxylase-like PLP-dependent enzyme